MFAHLTFLSECYFFRCEVFLFVNDQTSGWLSHSLTSKSMFSLCFVFTTSSWASESKLHPGKKKKRNTTTRTWVFAFIWILPSYAMWHNEEHFIVREMQINEWKLLSWSSPSVYHSFFFTVYFSTITFSNPWLTFSWVEFHISFRYRK